MGQTIKILIAEANLEKRIGLKKLLFQVSPEVKPILRDKEIEIVGEAESFRDVEILATKFSPHIIMSANLKDIGGGIESACKIAQLFSSTSVIVISEHALTQDELKKAMLFGVRSFLVQPVEQLELHKLIIELFELNNQKRERVEFITSLPTVISSKKIAIFGAKGGVGRTLLSTNLAVFMAKYLKPKDKKVALIDLDLQFGDIAIMLNLTPTKTITGLAKEIDELGEIDEGLMESYLIKYGDNLAVLPAPLKPEEADLIKAEHLEKILHLISQKYHFIIIDCSRILSESILIALSSAEVIILLLSLELPSIKNAKLSLEVMEKLGFGAKVSVVVNRANTRMGISIQEVKEALATPIMELIPSDGPIVIPSINEGIPFVIKYPKRKISKSIEHLAKKLIEPVCRVNGTGRRVDTKKWWQ